MRKPFFSLLLAFLTACGGDPNPTPDPSCIDLARIRTDRACPAVYIPVCGCDGKTYGNGCAADNAGVKSFTKGPCPPSR